VTKQTVTFELVNKEGEVVGNSCTVTWESVTPAPNPANPAPNPEEKEKAKNSANEVG